MFWMNVNSVNMYRPDGTIYIEKGRKLISKDDKREIDVTVKSIKVKGNRIKVRYSNGEKRMYTGYPFDIVIFAKENK